MSDNPFEEPSSSHNQRLLNTGSSKSSYGGSGGYQPKEVFGDSYVEPDGQETYKQELQFQNFQHTSQPAARGTSGTISSSGGGGAIIQPSQSTVVDFGEDHQISQQPLASGGGGGSGGGEGNQPPVGGDAPSEPPSEPTNAKFWTIQYYRPLFNVDTVQVLQRIMRSITPFRFGFIETAKTNPDFYGPFWIATTLIFVLAVIGNLSNTITREIHDWKSNHGSSTNSSSSNFEAIQPNFFMIVVGSGVFYGYTIIVPLILWGVFKYLQVPVKLLELICIYGYTLFIFIPVSVICLVPSEIMRWAVTIGASAWSGFFLVSNLLVTVKDIALKRGLATLVVVGALHVALGLTYKLYFFKQVY